jgi:hypothetical protein
MYKGKPMSLEKLYYISQFVAVCFIFCSLVAIFLQQRQSNTFARLDITQRAAAEYSAILKEVMIHPHLTEAFRKVMFDRQELTPAERTQISIYFNLTMSIHASAYRSVKADLIEGGYMEDNEHNIAWYLTAPDFAREWRRVQRVGNFGTDFVDHINKRFSDLYPDHDAATLLPTSDLDK